MKEQVSVDGLNEAYSIALDNKQYIILKAESFEYLKQFKEICDNKIELQRLKRLDENVQKWLKELEAIDLQLSAVESPQSPLRLDISNKIKFLKDLYNEKNQIPIPSY